MKENIDLRNLKRHGAVTFTTDGREYQCLLEECKQQKLKIDIRRFSSFITVVLR